MEVVRLLGGPSSHIDDSAHHDKENIDRDATPNVSTSTSSVAMAKVLTPAALNSTSQPHKAAPMDISFEEEKLGALDKTVQPGNGFAEGVRRESFPGNHLHTSDVSFNCEEVSIGDKSHLSDITHDEGMSFTYNVRSSTPISAHEVPLPSTVQRTRPSPSTVVDPPNASPERNSKAPLPTSLEGLSILSLATQKSQPAHPRSPLAFDIDTDTKGKDHLPGPGSGFIPPQPKLKSGPNPATGIKSLSARAAALRFILPDESLMEMDSILDVQFPEGTEEDFTAAFARLALGPSNSVPKAAKPQSTTPGLTRASEEHGLTGSAQPTPPSIVEPHSQSEPGSTGPEPTPDEADNSYLEDEHTLNIASLGLNGIGNTLLVDMSLDQLRSKPNEAEHENVTFEGSSFAIATSSATEWPPRVTLEAQTPKRTASNPLPHVEDGDMSVEATVKKARSSYGRVASDAVVDALRSGRALHRATSSISSVSSAAGLTNRADVADEVPLGTQVWPGSTASLRRTESFTSYPYPNTAEPRQYPGSAVPLQRTRSTISLRRTSSATSYQPDFMRPHSRASAVGVDSEDDEPYTPPAHTVSRGSSRRSSVYALPEPEIPSDHPAPYFDRPSSVASIYDRPTSAASIRPTSAASIRPPSAASIRTSSTRPTSVASSFRSGSAASSRRVAGAQPQPSPVEDELVRGMEGLMRGAVRKIPPSSTARNAQGVQNVRSTKITGVKSSATQDVRDTARSGIRQPPGSSARRAAESGLGAKSGLGPSKTLGPKNPSGTAGSNRPIGPGTRTVAGTGSAAKTMSAASGRSVPMTAGLGTRSTTSTLRSQSSIKSSAVRPRASTLGLFAPDGGPGEDQEPKKPTHKASSASISATPLSTRTLRPPTTTSSIRTLGARGTSTATGPGRAAATAGSIASLREAMKSKGTSKK